MKLVILLLFAAVFPPTVSLDLNEIKKMKTNPTTIATTTPTTTNTPTTTKTIPTTTTTTPTTTTTTPTTTTTTPTTTTTTVMTTTTTGEPEYITFTMTYPGAMLTDCPGGCATGWQYYGSKCYKKFNVATTYDQAVTACQVEGAELVTIDDSDENEALRKAFDTNALVDEPKETWIGLKSTSGSWKWTDGSSASFTNWAQTQPSSSQCVQMITDALNNATYQYQRGGWKTYDCSKTSASYICQRWATV